jgi:hypothetical protein
VSKNKATRRSFWLIVTPAQGRMEVLTFDTGGETVLPVFSFQEEGEFFLGLEATEADWWPRETTTGELVSLLLGLCAGVDKVALDPLPGLGGREIVELVSTGRRRFVRHLVGDVAAHHPERKKPVRTRNEALRSHSSLEGPNEARAICSAPMKPYLPSPKEVEKL